MTKIEHRIAGYEHVMSQSHDERAAIDSLVTASEALWEGSKGADADETYLPDYERIDELKSQVDKAYDDLASFRDNSPAQP